MPNTDRVFERILAYLKGLLSDRQRHDLEREMMRDDFDDEAFEGLSQMHGDELEADMVNLMKRLDDRTAHHRKRNLVPLYRMAAGLVILLGVGAILFMILRKPEPDLLTIKQEKTTPAETAVPTPPQTASPALKEELPAPPGVTNKQHSDVAGQNAATEETESIGELRAESQDTEPAMAAEPQEKAMAFPAERKVMAPPVSAKARTAPVYTGRVIDSQGEPLPGAVVSIKGTPNGTVADTEGKFTLPVTDSSAVLQASFIGYKTAEIKARENTIVMQEDLMALNEVVVIGYGVQKKSDITGAVSTIQLNKDAKADMAIVIKPVPPGGSLKEFKKWVNDRLDRNVIGTVKGKQKTAVSLTIKQDGTVSDVKVQSVSDAIATEYKRIIEQSPAWKPALRDDVPIESKVEIRFVTSVD